MRAALFPTIIWLMLVSTWPSLLLAHSDRVLQIQGTTLVGLPPEYGPAEFDKSACRLRIGNYELAQCAALADLLEQPHDLFISSSWYHDQKLLPPYLNFHIKPKSRDYSYQFLFDLRTLELLKFSVLLQINEPGVPPFHTQHLPVDPKDSLVQSIKSSVRKVQ